MDAPQNPNSFIDFGKTRAIRFKGPATDPIGLEGSCRARSRLQTGGGGGRSRSRRGHAVVCQKVAGLTQNCNHGSGSALRRVTRRLRLLQNDASACSRNEHRPKAKYIAGTTAESQRTRAQFEQLRCNAVRVASHPRALQRRYTITQRRREKLHRRCAARRRARCTANRGTRRAYDPPRPRATHTPRTRT